MFVPLVIAVTPVMTEALSRDNLKAAPLGFAGSPATPAWWISTR